MTTRFGILLIALLASIGVAVADVVFALPAPAAALPLIPLILYHLYLWRRSKTIGLSAADVDSVYYFGFLVTVVALAMTAIEISGGGGAALLSVLQKFGVGLGATAYAVIARMHLQSLGDRAERVEPEDLLRQAADRSGELLANLHEVSFGLVALSKALEDQTRVAVERATAEFEDAIRNSSRLFADEVTSAVGNIREGVVELRALISDAQFSEERGRLKAAVTATVESVETSNAALQALAGRADAAAKSIKTCDERIVAVGVGAERLGNTLTELDRRYENLGRVADGIDRAAASAAGAADAAKSAAAQATAAVSQLAQSANAIAEVATAAQNAVGGVNALGTSSAGLGNALADAATTIRQAADFAIHLERAGGSLPTLAAKTAELATGLDVLKGRLDSTASSIENDVRRSTGAAAKLADSLTTVAQTIIDRTNGRSRG